MHRGNMVGVNASYSHVVVIRHNRNMPHKSLRKSFFGIVMSDGPPQEYTLGR